MASYSPATRRRATCSPRPESRAGKLPCLVIELDGWLSVSGGNPERTRLLRGLRREIQDVLSWQALASLRNQVDVAAASFMERGVALLRAALSILTGGNPQPSDVELVAKWEAPEVKEAPVSPDAEAGDAEAGSGASPVAPQPKVEAKARAKPKAQAKKKTEAVQRRSKSTAVGDVMEDSESEDKAALTDSSELQAELESKTMVQLKEILRERGLKVGGRKAELVERCLGALAGGG
mmetsp:Transcript_41992/g.97215  ORF Transcript_41992/g.97215 Transcript_41992/m.97215 type:complete len:236 (+) Transcript_41992:862-1569(+)